MFLSNRLIGEHWVNAGNATVYAFTWDRRAVGPKDRATRGANTRQTDAPQALWPTRRAGQRSVNWGLPNGSATYYDYNATNELTGLHVVGGDFGGIQPGHTHFEYDATGVTHRRC